jgi:hypothetical protein
MEHETKMKKIADSDTTLSAPYHGGTSFLGFIVYRRVFKDTRQKLVGPEKG